MEPSRTEWSLFVVALLVGSALAAAAAETPAVFKRIPADTAYAILFDRPAESIQKGGAILEKFKSLHPDMDMAKLGAEVQAEMGENLLTADGMRAFGIDPAGTLAIYGSDFVGDPNLALLLLDSKRFIERVTAVYRKGGRQPPGAPAKRAGVTIYKFGPFDFALKDKWCLLVPTKGQRTGRGDPVKAFFGRGKKLARNKAFIRTLRGLPEGQHGLGYLSVAGVAKFFDAEMARQIESAADRVEKATPKSRKWLKTNLEGMRSVKKRIAGMLGQFEGIAGGCRFTKGAVVGSVFIGALPSGRRVLAQVLPAGSGQPAFHAGLLEASILGGWAAFKTQPFLEWAADLPVSPYRSIRQEMDQAAEEFGKVFQMDLFGDVLGNLRDPVAAYFLVPDLKEFASDAPPDTQFLQLIRFLLVLRVSEPAKAEQFLGKLDNSIQANGQQVQMIQADGASLRVMRPEPGVEISWGLKGDVLLFGFGPNVTAPAARLVDSGSFKAGSVGSDRGQARLDFAALGETMSSAVSKGIGGRSGTEFRMMIWPVVQQVLGRLGELVISGELGGSGLLIRSELGIR